MNRDSTYLSIIPSSQTVEYGETFSIVVHLDPGEPVIGVQIDLSFTPSLVQVVSVVKGNPIWFFLPPIINNSAGEIHGAAVVVFGYNVSTPIDCFEITFTAQNSDGTSPLILHDVLVTNQYAQPITPIINNGEVIVTNQANLPPFFGSPSPANGSTGNPLSLTWAIPINDPEGDLFSWTIQCSNGQSNSGTSATNGTKTVALSGLSYSTIYKVWVNATDPGGSDVYTRRWYTFTTKGSLPPFFGTPSPANGSTNQPLGFSWSIPINDLEGDVFSWTIQCSNGQSSSASGASNGTKTLALSGLSYATTYTVWVNATDPGGSGQYTRRWYIFTTKLNQPPIFGSPTPANGSTGNPLSFTWSIPINDPEGNLISWSIQCSNGQSSSGSGVGNGTRSLSLSDLEYSLTYKVWVNATDPAPGSGVYTRRWYVFTTEPNQPPYPPSNPIPANGSTGISVNTNLDWECSDPDGDPITYDVYFGPTNPPPKVASNISTSNFNPGTLEYFTYYYWRIIAWDDHDHQTSGPLWRFRTMNTINHPPNAPNNPSPVDGATEVPINVELCWDCTDPDGDFVTYDVYFGVSFPLPKVKSNISSPCHTVGNLDYGTKYYWKIVAWDYQTSNSSQTWSFTTKKDVTKPSLAITSPKEGYLQINLGEVIVWKFPIFIRTILIGQIDVTATATDTQSGMNRVEIWIDQELKANRTTPPYSWTWQERGYGFSYQITVKAYDNAGNVNIQYMKVKKWL